MSQTPTESTAPSSGSKPTGDFIASFEKALREAEASLKKLAAEAKAAAERSTAIQGAEADAKRLGDWMRERSGKWSTVVKELEQDASKFASEFEQGARRLGKAATERSATLAGLSADTKKVAGRIQKAVEPKKP